MDPEKPELSTVSWVLSDPPGHVEEMLWDESSTLRIRPKQVQRAQETVRKLLLKLAWGIQEEPKEGGYDQPPRAPLVRIHSGWEMCMSSQRTLSQTTGQARWLARGNLETNPFTIKPETVSHMAEQFSWVPFSCCSLSKCPFSNSLFFVSTCISWDNSLLSVRKESTLRPWKGPPSCYKTTQVDAQIPCLLPLAPFLPLM